MDFYFFSFFHFIGLRSGGKKLPFQEWFLISFSQSIVAFFPRLGLENDPNEVLIEIILLIGLTLERNLVQYFQYSSSGKIRSTKK